MPVVVLGVVGDEPLELVLVPDDGAVEQFAAQGADPALRDAVRPALDSRGDHHMDSTWSRDRYEVTETTDAVVVGRKMAVWAVITGPPEAILPVMNFETKPPSTPLGDRAIIDAATGEPVSIRHP